ncbi:CpsB/CapC family capsule biosynthesis tyrosine phosphatase [Butyrivibrio sp. MC2021]|uniref:CpsB/CapC family capsule biosynthesis tyrosine phosphatase n=1 Tax=Butyrivibrio sp. MC2021 TaxID=1408306 RepID=UPI00047E8FF6|nr:CpsB/CapC family capsule biosynthesis tyrosine phosphatase [Butyrivibrio sp. MC2021]
MLESIDIHCHIMPGVDDGSPDTDTSLKMLKIAVESGVRNIILTPHHKPMHHNVSPKHNAAYRQKLQEVAWDNGINVNLYSGNEMYFSDDTMADLECGNICTLAGSDYVLVEFHPTNPYKAIHNALYQVQGAGFTPVLAHVERYSDVVSHPAYVRDLVDMGCYIQVNANSIMGKYGFGTAHFTKKLIKEDLVHFVATDAHDTVRRAPHLAECRKYVERKYGLDTADRLFYDNPLSVIHNEII